MSDEKKLEKGTSGDDKVLRMGTASIPRLITEFAIPLVVGSLIKNPGGGLAPRCFSGTR